jgi:hypothetical protein
MPLLNKYYYMRYCLYTEDYIDSPRAVAEHTNPTGNRLGAMHASRRSLYHRSSSHLQLLSSVTARVSRLMVATQQVKEKT